MFQTGQQLSVVAEEEKEEEEEEKKEANKHMIANSCHTGSRGLHYRA
jgi:hypothetical protein